MNIGALFDLDGVIIDSETQYTIFWSQIDAEYPTGIPNFAIKIKGTNLQSIMAKYFSAPGTPADSIAKRLREFESNMPFDIFPEALRFLGDLKAAGVPRALVTSSGNDKMSRLWAAHPGLKSYFDAIVTGEMVSRTKPHPECFIKGAGMIGLKPQRCAVFEDSVHGVAAGIASGAKVVALATTFPQEVRKSKADKVIDTFAGFGLAQLKELF